MRAEDDKILTQRKFAGKNSVLLALVGINDKINLKWMRYSATMLDTTMHPSLPVNLFYNITD